MKYCVRVYAQAGTYEKAASQLGMGWREVPAVLRVDGFRF